MFLSHGKTDFTAGKNIYHTLNFNAFTINIRKQFIECLRKTQVTKKECPPYSTQPFTVLLVLWPPVPPKHCHVDWTIAFIYDCV